MYAHVHRKIELSSDLELTSLTWGGANEYIACGTSDGTLQLLSLNEDSADDSGVTITIVDRLSHDTQGRINKLLFDVNGNKLTSSDDLGLICVWKYSKTQSLWSQEKCYDRGKFSNSFVTDFSWSKNNKICIIYRDGFCLVGNSIGDREWSNQFDFELKLVQWSPNGEYLLIVTMNYELLVYKKENRHKYVRCDTVNLCFCDKLSNDALEIADINWNMYNNILCIAYKIGKIQIMKSYNDNNPILLDVDMIISKIQFNPNGNIIAIVGRKKINQKYINWLCFIDCFGKVLYELSMSNSSNTRNKKINDFCWERNGLRILVCIENIMYFAEIKTNYKYCYFANSFLCYSNNHILSNRNKYKSEIVYFVDTKNAIDINNNCKQREFIDKVLSISGNYESEYALIVYEESSNKNKIFASLYNAIGREIIKNEVKFEKPFIFIVTSLFVIIASKYIIYYFQHSHNKKLIELTSGRISSTSLINKMYHVDNKSDINQKSPNPIQSIYGINEYIIIARKFGDIICHSMLNETIKFKFDTKNQGINRINCNNDISRLSIINKNGSLQIYDISTDNPNIIIERNNKINNIREIIWSYSDNESFAIIDKSKLIICNNLKYEDKNHKINNNNLCLFKDLEVITFNFDKLQVVKYECKILSTIKNLLSSKQSKSVCNMIKQLTDENKDNNYNKLWQLLCYDSLKKFDFKMAEMCFIKMNDFFGIQFIKRLKLISDKNKQKAEIYSYFGEINNSEIIYDKMNDPFETLNLYLKIGNFEKIIHLITNDNQIKNYKNGINDKMINNIYKEIGHFYESKFNWNEALKYYLKSKDYKHAINAAYKIEDFNRLSQITKQIPSSSNLLKQISKMFIVNGLTKESSDALIKYGDIITAINNCIQYNDYKLALKLSKEYHQMDYFNNEIEKKIMFINNNKNIFEIIDIYKSVNQYLKTAKLLISHIEKLKQKQKNNNNFDPHLFQKLYVASAIQLDKHGKELLLHNKTKKTIDLLLETEEEEDINNVFGIRCWNGAVAYHLYILLQKQIYNNNININLIFICRILCQLYDEFLNETNLYSLYAYVSYKLNYFKDCSDSMTRLQFLCNRKNDKYLKKQYKKLAINIFTKNYPVNDYNKLGKLNQCKNINDADFNINNVCMASGKYINNSHIDTQSFVICNVCKYKTLKEYVVDAYMYCGLCHSAF